MKHTRKRVIALLLVATLVLLPGCSHDEKEFLADVTVPLENSSAEIVIKEWRWLLGSGAEIYYQKNDTLTLLGETTGGDNGYCPFAAGKFTLNEEGNELVVRWSFRGTDPEDAWRENRFAIPSD